jgi:hypothetical protein
MLRKLLFFAVLVQIGQCHFDKERLNPSSTQSKGSDNRSDGKVTMERSVLETTPPKDFMNIQRKFQSWYACNLDYIKQNVKLKRYFVPDDYVFLPYARTCTVTETKETIGTGKQTVLFAIDTLVEQDYSDDWKLGLCANTSDQAEQARFVQAGADNLLRTSAETKANLYSRVDGKDLPYFYVYDNGTNFFEECPGKELCPGPDNCDAKPLDTCKGLDAFPLFGWYTTDTRTWRNGDTHTYEFGVTNRNGTDAAGNSLCTRTKYMITAKGRNKCDGIFGLGFGFAFCPVSWLLYLLSRV